MRSIRHQQRVPYNLSKCEPLHTYLTRYMSGMTLTEDEQYARSLVLEPRQAAILFHKDV